MRTHRDQRGHLHIDEKDHRSEQAEIQTPELHLGGVHRSGVPGRHDAQGHRGDDAANQYEHAEAAPDHRLGDGRDADDLADDEAGERDDREARGEEADPGIVAMLLRDELG